MEESKRKLLEAAIKGKAEETENGGTWLDQVNPDVLCKVKTAKGSTCLHIASLCGHQDFCRQILAQEPRVPSVSSLLSDTNLDGETPLLVAVKNRHVSLAEYLLEEYSRHGLHDDLLKKDKHGENNVLHYAICNGYKELALELIEKQPALSKSHNKRGESPMFMAVLKKGFKDVYAKLLSTEKPTFTGSAGYNVLHAAVKYGDEGFIRELLDRHFPTAKDLATQEDHKKCTPMHLIAHFNRVEILKIMLHCFPSFGYVISSEGESLLYTVAERGHVDFARALLEHCPDAPYCNNKGRTCLHRAVEKDQIKFVEFILEKNSKLEKLVNMVGDDGESPLHLAILNCNQKMVSALLGYHGIDVTVDNKYACTAIWKLNEVEDLSKTINWNKIFLDVYEADRRAETDIYNIHVEVRNKVINASRKDATSLIVTYTGNTSLVAILITTITFAAAFTLPGGYSSEAGNEGLPIMARKIAFQAFLFFDTLAMCSTLAIAFICVIARWKDFEFLLRYRFFTKKVMWFAYVTTTLAFATGLYTVLADGLHWLAIAICVLSALLPILTMLIGEWPILKLKIRYCNTPFNSNFLDMV